MNVSEMRPVDQQITMDDVAPGDAVAAMNGGREAGDCLRACTATILQLNLDDVPHFVQYVEHPWGTDPHLWYWALVGFCDAHGWRVDWLSDPDQTPAGWSMASGHSRRGHGHVCVAYDGEIVHDPHPARSGLTSRDGWFTFERRDH